MKKLLLVLIVFCGAIILGVLASGLIKHDDGTKNNNPPHDVTTTRPNDDLDPVDPVKSTVLPILGVSDFLTDEQVKNMNEWREAAVKIAEQYPEQVYCSGPGDEKMVCLTFDDGPDAEITPRVLDTLRDYNVKASFFFKGNRVKKYRSVVKRAFNDGHLVLSHAYSHQELDKMSPHDIDLEIIAAQESIAKVTGREPAIIRPPFGAVNDDVINEFAKYGNRLVLWSIDTLDWSHKDRNHIARNVLDNVRNGDIILMHSDEDKGETAAALPIIIEGLQERGYQIVTLDKMLGVEAYQKQD
ncbi:MAG: polysaccharide deacetylase family protein [Syntrophomonadales bacterium]|jgi:peptidoglycan/xylan/chitin deacetylase (PgdA/CDA1 family)